MRIFLTLSLLLALPCTALAQNHSSAPLVVVNSGNLVTNAAPTSAAPTPAADVAAPVDTNKMIAAFPATAVTSIAKTTPAPSVPSTVPAPTGMNKLWPRDTVDIFMKSCAKTQIKLAQPCNCIITNLMEQMGHDEFMRLNEAGTIEQEPRLQAIRQQCSPQPQPRQ